ncbi:MAG: HAMP domain-containing sensor histidine kinase [Arcobacteraceae bacterium]|nr:HAMP domain-containing sensor histidine kinase [Arcobacteraceae bacterium]
MQIKNIKLHSVSKQLLKVVFAFYFSITIIITLIHFTIEYYHTKENINNELKMVSQTFMQSIQGALWNFDMIQVKSITSGALQLPSVLSIKIFDKNTNQTIYNIQKPNFDLSSQGVFSYSQELYHTTLKNETVYVGTIQYFSNHNIVIERVKLSFFIILFNSILKSLILTILFIWAFNKYLTKPLEKITNDIKNIDLHHLKNHKTISVDTTKKDELTFLSIAFNDMLKNFDEKLNIIQETNKHLIESEKMAALGGMVAGISHEINTPVGIALTGITYLQEQTINIKKLYEEENMSEEDFLHYLDDANTLNNSIQINLQKAASLINSFKKVAVDQSSNEERKINLKEYIEEIILSLHSKIKKTNISIVIDIEDNILLTTKPGAISQIITNLIANSLTHGFENQQSGEIKITAKLEENNLHLRYQDDGKGISKDVEHKIFNPFFTTNRANGGSGLGMSIVFNLVTTVLSGEIDLQSELHKGIIFDIIIPIQKG